MKLVSLAIPETLVEYIKLQVLWVQEKKTGSLKLNYYQGGISSMNREECLKLTVGITLRRDETGAGNGPHS